MVTKQKALEIIGDPFAKEREWMCALQVVDYKVPSLRKRRAIVYMKRFVRRYIALSLAYFAILSGAALPDLIFAGDPVSFGFLLMSSFMFAGLERVSGIFTLGMLCILPGMIGDGSFLTLSLRPWSIFAVLGLNLYLYHRGWIPELWKVPMLLVKYVQNRPQLQNKTQAST
jgi:hypothetical protein